VFTDYVTNINLSGGYTNEQSGGLFSFLKHHEKVYLNWMEHGNLENIIKINKMKLKYKIIKITI